MANQMPDPKNMAYLVNDTGETVAVPKDQASAALQQGYRPATGSEIAKFGEAIKYSGDANAAKAFGLGAARAISFGTSDIGLTKTGLVEPETISGLEEHQPEASLAGEATGVGASLLIPFEGEAAATSSAARAAARAATAPVRAVSRVGQAVTRGAESMLPEATGVLGKAAKSAAAHGAGAAAEGAIYGAGRTATEYAEDKLGDPGAIGESLLHNAGMASVLAGGMGSALGFTGSLAKSGINKLGGFARNTNLPAAGPAVIDTVAGPEAVSLAPEGTIERAMQEEGVPSGVRDQVLKASNRLHPDANARIAAANDIGAPILESYISGADGVRTMDAGLMTSQTFAGQKRLAMLEEGFDRARKPFTEALEVGEKQTPFEAGEAAKGQVLEEANKLYSPIKSGYKEAESLKNIPVPEELRITHYDEMLSKNTGRPGGTADKIWRRYGKEMMDVSSLEHLDDLISDVGNEQGQAWRTGDKKGAHTLGEVRESLGDLRDKLEGLSTEQIALRDSNRAAYKKFIETLGDLAASGKGLGKIRNYSELLERLDKIPSQKFAEKLFDKKNIEGLRFLKENFKDVFDTIVKQQKTDLLETAFKEGRLDPVAAGKALKKLPKEVQQLMFSPEQLNKMNSAYKYSESQVLTPTAVSKINPSGTEKASAARRYHTLNPHDILKAAGQDVMAKITEVRLAASAEEAHAITRVEQSAAKTFKKIASKAKAIFGEVDNKKGAVMGFLSKEAITDREKQEKMISTVRELRANPDKFVALLEKNTQAFQGAAPKSSASVHEAAVRAVNYLADSAPETESHYPLGEKPVPSKYEMNIFAERLHVLNDPTSILDEIKHGTLVPAHVEALQAVYPKLYQQMQGQVLDSLTDAIAKKQTIPYQTKNMLSLFLNQDLDASITAQSVLANQAAMHRAGQEQAQQEAQMSGAVRPSQKGLGNLTANTQYMTAMQKSGQRIDRG